MSSTAKFKTYIKQLIKIDKPDTSNPDILDKLIDINTINFQRFDTFLELNLFLTNNYFFLENNYYAFSESIILTKKFIGNLFSSFVIIENNMLNDLANINISFYYKEMVSNSYSEKNYVKKIKLDKFRNSNIIFFPFFILLTAEKYLFDNKILN